MLKVGDQVRVRGTNDVGEIDYVGGAKDPRYHVVMKYFSRWYWEIDLELIGEKQQSSKFWVVWCETGANPKVQQMTKDDAETEAKRLAQKYPGKKFHVLESIGTAQTITVEYKEHK